MSRPLLRVLILVAVIAIVIPAASSANATSPPTWPNLYDWPASGQGYVGWHSSTAAPNDYGMQPALGDQHGLWLWPLGGHKTYNTTDYAQWTYTAPGTTRLKTVTLSYAWSNKLLAHHCIDIGLVDASGKIIDRHEACKPPPQSPLEITLTDPDDNPTSKVLYFRIHVDCGGASSCSKTIPTKDPLKNGAYARLLKADMTLVDDDNPVLTPSGGFFDLAGTAIYGDRSYDLTANGDDAGAGVTRVWLEQNGVEIASVDVTCDTAHNTPPLDNRICPEQKTLSTSIDTSKLAEGAYIYVVKAEDVAGNVGESQSWLVVIDRTPPVVEQPSGSFYDLRGTTIVGDRSYGLTVNADDPLSGVSRIWLEQNGTEIASASATCNPAHNPLPPDNRICPLQKTLSLSIDTTTLADGSYTYLVKAVDAAGNVGQGESWTIVIDRTPPSVALSGSLYDLRGETVDGEETYDLTVNTDDSGSGVTRVWLEQNGAEIASAGAACNPAHNTPPSDNPCPEQQTLSTSVDASSLADGTYTYVAKAQDAVGNVAQSESWTLVVDRTSADDQYASGDDGESESTAGSDEEPGGGADGYDPELDNDPACDAYVDLGIPDACDPTGSESMSANPSEPTHSASARVEATVTEAENQNPASMLAGSIEPTFTESATADAYSGCELEAVFWAPGGAKLLMKQLVKYHVSPECGDYLIATNPGDGIVPNPGLYGVPQGETDKRIPTCQKSFRGNPAYWEPNFHAAPVFQWSSWNNWKDDNDKNWYEAGVEFRRRMAVPGSGCDENDKWFVNELPTRWHALYKVVGGEKVPIPESARVTMRRDIVNALRGLHDGPELPIDINHHVHKYVKGFTTDVVSSHKTTNLGEYKDSLVKAYKAANFWDAIPLYVDGWSKEVYTRCSQVCVPGKTTATIANKGVNNYAFHQRRLALDAPSGLAVKTTLKYHHMPLLNGIWNYPESKSDVYDTRIPRIRMIRLLRLQVYSARAVANSDYGSRGRIGFAWKETGLSGANTDTDATVLAANLAQSIKNAYQLGHSAAYACKGADGHQWCPPGQSGASFNDHWDIFQTWPQS